jgi:transcriptional regulator with XRE-family HTH domain
MTDLPTGTAIRALRRGCQLTQKALATAASLHVNSVKRLERFAVVPGHSSYSLAAIAKVLNDAGAEVPAVWARWSSDAEEQLSAQLPHGVLERALASDRVSGPVRAPARTHGVLAPGAEGTKMSAPKEVRCEAKTRAGTPCRHLARPNGRCRLHGGLSTGPKSAEGRARIAAAQRARWAAARVTTGQIRGCEARPVS